MPSVNSSGSQACSVGTEHTLATITASGTYVLVIDVAPLLSGDTLEVRIYGKVLAGSTPRPAYMTKLIGPVSNEELIQFSVPVPVTHYFAPTLKQTAGTGRTIDWEIRAL